MQMTSIHTLGGYHAGDFHPHCVLCIIPGMYQGRDMVLPGTINVGTRGNRKFIEGLIVSRCSVTPPKISTSTVYVGQDALY